MSNSVHDYSNLKTFEIDKDLFEQDFQKETCIDERFVPFSCIKIDTAEQLFSFFEKVYHLEKNGEEFFYRGQSNSDWLLVSTLEREIEGKISMNEARQKIFSSFLKKLRGNLVDQSLLKITHTEHERELWAIGRHYDLKTPYLDWSKSIYVALFMANSEPKKTDEISEYSALFMVNANYFPEYHGIMERFWFTPKTDYYGRITAQKGYLSEYTIRDYIKKAIEHFDNIKNEKHQFAFKIYIKNELRNEILHYLNHIGINYSSMYPDLQGVVKSVNNELTELLIQRSK